MKKIYSLLFLMLSFGAIQAQDEQESNEEDVKEEKKDLPLEGERTFSIKTNEGSWLSLDVSPDGQTIVFDFLGDLYTMPFAGGEATQITSGMSFDGQPRFSPDGKHVVFTSDRDGGENIWTMELASAETNQITKGKANRYQSPEWDPTGEYIYASMAGMRRGTIKIHMYHKDGGKGVTLMKDPERIKMTGAAFSNDPRYIWFAQRSGDWEYNAIFPQYQIARYDRETGERETMSSRFGSAIRPTLSPDGKWLVYGTRYDAKTGLVKRDLATGDESWLAYPVQRDDQESRATRDALPGMSFTPDSKQLIVSYGGKIYRLPIAGGDAIEIPFTVDTSIELGPELDFEYPIADSEEFIAKQIRDAKPSPDGKKLTFTVLDKLYVMEYPNGTPKRLTDFDFTEAMPAWSPNGEYIAFVTWTASGEGNIYKVRADGRRDPIKLTTDKGIYRSPVWSPDGNRIVSTWGPAEVYLNGLSARARGSETELIWVSADGGSKNVITRTNGRSNPHFADKSDRIYLNDGDDGLLSIRWDGTDEKYFIKVTGEKPPGYDSPIEASEIFMAPDGKHAIAQVYNDIYLVTVPMVGGETPTISVANPENAIFPAKKLSDIGGDFPVWSGDGNNVHWSIGNAFVTFDLEAEKAKTDSLKAADADKKTMDSLAYEPLEKRIKVTAKRDIPQGEVVLRGARVITMVGDEVIENADVYIKNNRIQAIGQQGEVEVPASAQVIDVAGKTIIPGYVDTHAHLRALWGVHRNYSWAYMANLAYGVTTTRDPQTSTTDVLTYEDRVKSGDLLGPRVYSTGPGVFWNEQIKDQDHARKILKRYSEYYDTKTIKMYVSGNRQQRQWIIIACREQELMPTTEGSLNLKQNLTQIIDGYPGHEHSFPVFPLYEDVVKLVAESQTTYTPTLLVAYGGPWAENYFYATEDPHDNEMLAYYTPKEELDRKTRRRGSGTGPGPGGWFMDEEHVFEDLAKVVKDIVEEGGKAGVGSHGQLQGLGYHWELWAMQSGGLSAHDALKVATIHGAEAIGLEKDLGTIEKGKLADLVILDKNPLDDIRNSDDIDKVMLNGRLYEAENLNQVYPENISTGTMWWHNKDPKGLPGVKE